MTATRDDWKTTPLPTARATIAIDRTYAAPEFERLKEGNVPQDMDDKWFVYYEEPWLYLHRSWSGFCIYNVRLKPPPGGYRVAEVLVNRDPAQCNETDGTRAALLLAVLLARFAGRDTGAAWKEYMASVRA